jgi:hypothetical protein
MTKLIVQVVHSDYDSFWEVEGELIRRCLQEPDLKRRKICLLDGSKETAVHSTRSVDLVLVLDGVEDQESWQDAQEYLEG